MNEVPITEFAAPVLIAAMKAGFLMFMVMNFAYVLSWMERKQSALMQDRIGANRADIFGFTLIGLFNPIADAIKMITKEEFVPEGADRFLHSLAPVVALFFALVAFAVIPFGNTIPLFGHEVRLQVLEFNVGVLYVFAALSMGIYGFVLAGWSSNNNFALLGGLRAASQMIAYEITMGATIVGIIMVYGTLDLQAMNHQQGELWFGWIPKWGVFMQPLGLLLFATAAMAETKRAPFDLPEGESEIIGYFTEYSGMKFGMFFTTDFLETVVASAMVTTLFFGGWQVPYLGPGGFHFPWGGEIALSGLVVALLQIGAFFGKVFFFCWFFLLVRWTLPRFRYDQLMSLGWKMMLPISLLNIVATGLVIVLIG